jgi:hydrogenase nickel incorporation protein HypA/HybF
MHEVGLMREAVALALAQAAAEGGGRVSAIGLRVGPLSGVVPDALALAFEVAIADTPADGARLAVEATPVVCGCGPCGREFTPPDLVFACPACGAMSDDVRRGRELEVAYVEIA